MDISIYYNNALISQALFVKYFLTFFMTRKPLWRRHCAAWRSKWKMASIYRANAAKLDISHSLSLVVDISSVFLLVEFTLDFFLSSTQMQGCFTGHFVISFERTVCISSWVCFNLKTDFLTVRIGNIQRQRSNRRRRQFGWSFNCFLLFAPVHYVRDFKIFLVNISQIAF